MIVNWKVWGLRILAFLILFMGVSYMLMDEEQKEAFIRQTDVSRRLYDYWDYQRYEEDLINIKYWGTVSASVEGDTAGLGISDEYYTFVLMQKFEKFFNHMHYYDVGQIISAANPELIDSTYVLPDHEIGYMHLNVSFRRMMGRVYCEMELVCGTEMNPNVYSENYKQLFKPNLVRRDSDRFVDLLAKSFAKRFFKIMQDWDHLQNLYRSVYRT